MQEDAPPIPAVTDPSFRLGFDNLWRRYEEADRQGDVPQSERILDQIRRLRIERNTFQLHDVALSFAFKGRRLLDAGDIPGARRSFLVAQELDSGLPSAHLGLARAALQSGFTGVFSALRHTIAALLSAFRSPWNGYFARADLLSLAFVSLVVLFFVFGVLMLGRYGLYLNHDLSELLERPLGKQGVWAVTALVLMVPVIATVGLVWIAPYWLAVTFAYQSVRERVISLSALFFILLSTPLFEFHASWTRTLNNPEFRAALSSLTGTFRPSDLFVLQQLKNRKPQDRDVSMLLAAQYKNLGEYDLSAAQYHELLAAQPDDLGARVNLGNVYYAQGDLSSALNQYDVAIQSNPRSALAHYNKSQAHAGNFQFREKEDARAIAEDLDSDAVSEWDELTRLAPLGPAPAAVGADELFVIDVRLDAHAVLAKFWGSESGVHDSRVSSLFSGALNGAGMPVGIGALLLGALTLGLHFLPMQRNETRRCVKCGRAFCSRCQIGRERGGMCSQCYHLFFVRDGVSKAARNERLARVRQRGRNRHILFRLMSILAPGSGHIIEESTLLGVALLLPSVLVVIYLFGGASIYPLPDYMSGFNTSLGTYSMVFLLLVLIVVANSVTASRQRR